MRELRRVGLLAIIAAVLAGCIQQTGDTPPSGMVPSASALRAAGDVDSSASVLSRRFRTVPLPGRMQHDVELLSGHPDSAGEPFVMRIRELAGTIIPPHGSSYMARESELRVP